LTEAGTGQKGHNSITIIDVRQPPKSAQKTEYLT